ncbi:MAG: hypothetical protein Q8P56_03170, partial [Candidatus Uhrbacteria bacterium]|nr:hypothetical protein [Candidatus Uhrbacteria bacterium]
RTCDCMDATHTKHYAQSDGIPDQVRDDNTHACRRPFQTTWDPALDERVYCKECFLEEMV